MALAEPPTRMALPVAEASLLTMVMEHLVEDSVEVMAEEPPLPAETTELPAAPAVVDLVEVEGAAPQVPAALMGLLEVDLKVDSEAAPPLPVGHMAPLEEGLVVEEELAPPPLAAPMAPLEVDVVAVEELAADVVVAVPQLQVDLTELPEVDLRVDLEEAPPLPVDLMAPLLPVVAEDLEALVAVTRLDTAMLEELPQPVDLTALQVAEEAQADLVAVLLLLAAITAHLAVVTSPDMDLAEDAEEGPAVGTAGSSSDPGGASPHPLTGRTSATSRAGPPSPTGSKTRTSRQQQLTR